MALAKGRQSKTKSQVSDIRTIGPLVFTSSDQSRYTLWSYQNVCDTLSYLADNIHFRFGTKLYRQLLEVRWVQIAPLLLLTYFYNATKTISLILLTMTIRLMLSRLLIRFLVT